MSLIEHPLRRDRQLVLTALLLLVALAWAYLVHLAHGMPTLPHPEAMPMPGMEMASAAFPQPWSAVDLLIAFAMWTAMMVGMMGPSFAPTILLYAALGRLARSNNMPFADAAWFAGGYFLAWTIFSLAAALSQTTLNAAMLLTPMHQSASSALSGAILVIAGLYQWSRWKTACLGQCREPVRFIQQHGGFQPQPSASLVLGLRHGLFCVGCCWALMLLLFVVGVMNLAWIAALSVLLMAEKLWVHGVLVSRAVGIAAIAWGLYLICQQWV